MEEQMNYYFLFNLGFTLTVFFLPLVRIDFVADPSLNLFISLTLLFATVLFVTRRGKSALRIKGEYLYCYSFPFLKKYPCEDIKHLELQHKKVRVVLQEDEVEIDYFFGIKGAVDEEVYRKFSVKESWA